MRKGVKRMSEQEKAGMFEKFNDAMHRIGRVTLIVSIALLVAIPFLVGYVYDAMPDGKGFLAGFAKVAIIYYPVAIVEFLVYTPMLGAGGSYITFLTGNVTNMKIPCAMNARDIAGTKEGTPEHEVVTTLSVATSALVTTAVVAVGVLLIVPLTPILENPVLVPAFDNVVPALFGALGLKYFLKEPKVAAVPVILMIALCVLVPAAISQTSMLIIPSGGLAIAIAYLLWKYDKLK